MTHAHATTTWWSEYHGADAPALRVAYFSHGVRAREDLPIYSGGLGVLAGDHLKAAAELGIPLVGVGLLYRGGYFRQGVDDAGRQTEAYERVDPEAAGLVREPVTVDIQLNGEALSANVWRKDVGSVPLYLLEVELAHRRAVLAATASTASNRSCCSASAACARSPRSASSATVFHMNEGHSAFLAIERVARARRRRHVDRRRARARQALDRLHHAHARAGRQRGVRRRARHALRRHARRAGGHRHRRSCRRSGSSATTADFGMTPLALRLSAYANGVSELHGEVAREMWAGLSLDRRPQIGHVTNGVHLGTWLEPALAALLREHGVDPAAPPAETPLGRPSTRSTPSALWRRPRRCEDAARRARRASIRSG